MRVLTSKTPSKRQRLLAEIPWFVKAVAGTEGVSRISLLGSITTEKLEPKDIDFLVVVDDDADLEPLAKVCRKLKGHAQSAASGADIFLVDPKGEYIGRICHWSECGWGRKKCEALNCGERMYLSDDFKVFRLRPEAMAQAIELWPRLEMKKNLPPDLQDVLRSLGK